MRYFIDACLAPIVKEHDGVLVVRDDLFAGGTKARFIPALFDQADEVVYASSVEGGAQVALATVARRWTKRPRFLQLHGLSHTLASLKRSA